MTEYSKEMVTCMGTLSQLSPMELVDLAEAIEKEHKAREDKKCREKIRASMIAAMTAINELSDYYDYLEIESENGMMNIHLTDLVVAFDQLLCLY